MNRNKMDEKNNKDLFEEITKHLLEDEKPSDFLNSLSESGRLQEYPFRLLEALKKADQSVKYHPEGNVWNHTMLVVDEAAKVRKDSTDAEAFMWAALLHDIGKPETTRIKNDRITSYDHDKVGEKLSIEFLTPFVSEDMEFIRKVSLLVRYHMHNLYYQKKLPFADMTGLRTKVNSDEIALLCRCDRLGRTGADKTKVQEEYKDFLTCLRRMQADKS